MKSRRAFVRNTTLATMALLAARSVNAMAGISNTGRRLFVKKQPLVFLHNAVRNNESESLAYSYFSRIRTKSPNTLVLNAGKVNENYNFDNSTSPESIAEYQIIERGNIRTGIITIAPNEPDPVSLANRLAKELKEEKNCQLVVCLSHLGYKKSEGLDDLGLANKSTNIDMIFGGHPENYTTKTMVVFNRERREVIVQSSVNEKLPCGKLEILLDENGEKRFIHVAAKLYQESFA